MTGARPPRGGDEAKPGDWATVLDDLEADVLAAEATISGGDLTEEQADAVDAWRRGVQDWVPPSGLGPLPHDLRHRAARLLQHQLAVAEELVERIIQSRRQRDVAARMSYAPSRPVAGFIDQAL